MKMLLASNIRYRELFEEVMPDDVETILKGIPSEKTVIPHLCYINFLLYVLGNEADQIKMLDMLLKNLKIKKPIIERLLSYATNYKNGSRIIPKVFSQITTFRFITYELNNERKVESESLPELWDLIILKAYVWFDLQTANDIAPTMNAKLPEQYKEIAFQWSAWPILIRQYEFFYRTDDAYKFIKILLTFRYLMSTELVLYVDNYIIKKGFSSFEDLVYSYMDLQRWMTRVNKHMPFIKSDHHEPILDLLSLDKDKFRVDVSKQKDVIHIREKPLYNTNSKS
ncbi:hypothetical protein [Spirosoma utsteinense]|uniref:Uncharacterized protein n=1 Tax=Spirosoma utsteinense TaxID=2585773 RepID=A0ABR6W5V9_9BACT|nr:hypothetical protein [Spirosoma utsteinense]MBC3791978.1 hypothetical protein [Spirosoma utsteinense]